MVWLQILLLNRSKFFNTVVIRTAQKLFCRCMVNSLDGQAAHGSLCHPQVCFAKTHFLDIHIASSVFSAFHEKMCAARIQAAHMVINE